MNLNSYKLAYAYKKTHLWKKMWDSDLFAVKTAKGQIIYVCIMGKNETYNALAVYPDSDSFQSYYRIYQINNTDDYIGQNDTMLTQDNIQLAFDDKEDLTEKEIIEIKNASKKLGFSLKGRNSYFHYLKFEPYCVAAPLKDSEEAALLDEAVSAAVDLAGLMEGKSPLDLGIHHFMESDGKLVLMEKKGDQYVINGTTDLPQAAHITYPAGKKAEKEDIDAINAIRQKGTLQCRIVPMMAPVEDEDPAYFPMMLMTINEADGKLLRSGMQRHYEPDGMLLIFIDMLEKEKLHPSTIEVCDDKTEQLLKAVCRQLNINLKRVRQLDSVDFAYHGMMQFLSMRD